VLPAVVAAVNRQARGARIPAQLSPPLAQLTGDHYDYPDGCAAHEGETTSQLCHLGSPTASRTIAVIGDSHAQMWMPAILAMADKSGWTVVPIGKSACTAQRWRGSFATSQCRTWYRWAVEQAKKLHPDVTILGGAYSNLVGDEAAAAADAINTTLKSLHGSSRHLLVLGDVPHGKQEPVDCLLARRSKLADCSTTPSAAHQQLTAEIAAIAGAGFLDTSGWVCYEQQCPMVVGHTVVYSDDSHVSKTYATALAQPFAAAVRRAIRR
jgi:hypothetical protein